MQRLDHRQDVFLAQGALGVRRIQPEAHVHLDPANGGQVIALRIEEQRVEQPFGGFAGRRLAGAQNAVDFQQRLIVIFRLVGLQRVAHVGAGVDMIDVKHAELLVAALADAVENVLIDLVAGLAVNLAGLCVHQLVGQELPVEILVGEEQLLDAIGGQLVGLARGDLLPRLDDHLAGIGVHQVMHRLGALQPRRIEGRAPSALLVIALEGHGVIEVMQDFFRIHAQRIKQRRHRQLAAAVDAHMDDVLGVELEIQPGAAVGDDARREQQLARGMGLAPVMIEEHTGRAVHLRDDDALGAIDDEGAVLGHERNVAHVNVLFLDVLDRLGLGVRVDFKHDQAQGDLQRRGIGHAPLLALFHIVFRRLEFVGDELQRGLAGEIRNRKNRFEHRLKAALLAPALGVFYLQELIVGFLLNLDQVRHLRHFLDVTEILANALASINRHRHFISLKSKAVEQAITSKDRLNGP